ncbi:MAG: ribonuclease P protein component [Spirochaetales bacterium]|nr:ribonuclease P protein component [Spirochaetales bacterium]
MRRSLTKSERLKKKQDFQRVFSSPLRVSCQGAKLLAVTNSLDRSRLGVGLSKKFGNAIQRNRAKRQIREIFRLNKGKIPKGFDVVILVYPGDFSYHERENQVFRLLEKARLET